MKNERTIWTVLAGLLLSRKFLLLLVAVIVAVVAFVQGGITADALVSAIIPLFAVLIAAIAGEDMAAKFGNTGMTGFVLEVSDELDGGEQDG